MSEKKRLGRGLSALIGERTAKPASGADGSVAGDPVGAGTAAGRLLELPLTEIAASTRQPRRVFDEQELTELADSIRNLGLIQPVVVRPAAEGAERPWELIAGERRLRAAALAGVGSVPALVRRSDDAASLETALAENVSREDLNAIEEAHAYAALADEFGLTHERIGELVGKSRVAVSNTLRLLDLPDDVQTLIEAAELSEGHGRALLGAPDHGDRRRLARLVVDRGLTVRQTERLVRRLGEGGGDVAPARPASDPAIDDLVDELYGLLEVPVRIRSGKRGGRLELRFRDRDELDRLIALLRSVTR